MKMKIYSYEQRGELARDLGVPLPVNEKTKTNEESKCLKNPNNLKFFLVQKKDKHGNITEGVMTCNESESQPYIHDTISVINIKQISLEEASNLTGVTEW